MNVGGYQRADQGQLLFGTHALAKFDRFRQTGFLRREAGGVLLGRHLISSPDLIVDDVTTPQWSDRRTRRSFFRSFAHHEIALRRWRESGHTCAYLGLWHTHPEPDPVASHVDLIDWRDAIERHQFEGDTHFFVIVGQRTTRVWQGWRDACRGLALLSPTESMSVSSL